MRWKTSLIWLPAAALLVALAASAAAQTQPGEPPAGPATQAVPVQTKPAAQPKPTVHPAGTPRTAATKPAVTAEVPHDTKGTANAAEAAHEAKEGGLDFMSMLFVFMLATFIGVGVIRRVSRLLHTPLMSLTNAISAIAVVGSIMVAGGQRDYPVWIRVLGGVALFCSMTNIISGFLITDRMLKMFKTREGGRA